jgi:hypothetical protein
MFVAKCSQRGILIKTGNLKQEEKDESAPFQSKMVVQRRSLRSSSTFVFYCRHKVNAGKFNEQSSKARLTELINSGNFKRYKLFYVRHLMTLSASGLCNVGRLEDQRMWSSWCSVKKTSHSATCPLEFPHELTWDMSAAIRSRRLTAWNIARR